MEGKVKNIIITINYTFLTISMITSGIINVEHSIEILFLYFLVLSLYTARTYFLGRNYEKGAAIKNTKNLKISLLKVLTYLIEIAIVLMLQSYDIYLISITILLLILQDIVLNTSYKISISSSIGIYIMSCLILYFKFIDDNSKRVISMLLILIVYVTVFIIFSLIDYLLKQNRIIEASLNEISIKNIDKDNLYRNLKEAYSKVESITILRERNKIASEIHDTVGHTLTTVLIELEASRRLINKDTSLALEKLNLAQEQIRKGLNDIRSSVRILERGEDILDFFQSLEALIGDTEKHSDVVVKRSIDKSIKLSKNAQEIIFAALMEGLSNGLRHGKGTAFIFKLYHKDDKLYFSLQDNGIGTSVVSPGFGLRAMRTRVEELSGKFDIYSEVGQGFSLDITFPLIKVM